LRLIEYHNDWDVDYTFADKDEGYTELKKKFDIDLNKSLNSRTFQGLRDYKVQYRNIDEPEKIGDIQHFHIFSKRSESNLTASHFIVRIKRFLVSSDSKRSIARQTIPLNILKSLQGLTTKDIIINCKEDTKILNAI